MQPTPSFAATTVLRIFISCPGDVEPERDVATRVTAMVGGRWSEHVLLETYDYREKSFDSTTSFQEQVPDVAGYDLVVGIVWKRIGTRLNPQKFPQNAGPLDSGTVYELETAFAAAAVGSRPDVVVFRKQAPVFYDANSYEWQADQHKKLERWWKKSFGEMVQTNERAWTGFQTTAEFAELFERWLEDWLRKRGAIPSELDWDIARDGSPYPGLVCYELSRARVFRGRDASVRRALALLRRRAANGIAALFIVGPSGSGKSSFARAGLAPRLLAPAGLEGIDNWRQSILEPGAEPIRVLANRLYGVDSRLPPVLPELADGQQPDASSFAALVNESPKAAAEAVAWALTRTGLSERLLLIADQFEALFDAAVGTPLTVLLAALVRQGRTVLIATLRSDRYALLQGDASLAWLRGEDGVFDLPPPGPEELREIVDLPASEAGLQWETGTDGAALNDVLARHVASADALPLLQMTLHELFEQRDKSSNLLSFASYQSFGGIEGAIAARADAAIQPSSSAARAELNPLLRELVADIDAPGEFSLRVVARDWYAGHTARSELVKAFVEARLLVEDAAYVRVAHEALLRHWPMARDSTALQPETLRINRMLRPLAARWQRSGSDEDLELAPTLLTAAAVIVAESPGALDELVERFVHAAKRALEIRQAAELGKARSAELAATARVELGMNHDRALRFAIEAYESSPTAEAIAVLRESLHTSRCRFVFDAGVPVANIGFVPGKPWIVSGHRDGSAQMWDVESRSWLRDLCGVRQYSESAKLAVDPTGQWIAVSQGSLVTVLDLDTGTERSHFDCFNCVRSLAFDTNGTRLVVAHGATAQLHDATSGNLLRKWSHTVIISAGFSADGKYVVGNFDDGHTVDVWSPDSDFPVFIGYTGGRTRASITDPKGRWLIAASSAGVTLYLLTAIDASGSKVRSDAKCGVTVGNKGDAASCLALVDEQEFVAGYENGLIQAWALSPSHGELSNWRPELTQLAVLIGHRGQVTDIAWNPHADLLASAGEDGTVRLWERRASRMSRTKWTEFAVLRGHPGRVWRVKFSTDGQHLASIGDGNEIRLWDIGPPHEGPIAKLPMKPLAAFDTPTLRVDLLQINYDASRLLILTRGSVARLWNCESGRFVTPLGKAESQGVLYYRESPDTRNASFSPDGQRILTTHADGTAGIWEASAGQLQHTLRAPKGAEFLRALFDNTGQRVLTLDKSGTVRLYAFPSRHCVRKLESPDGAAGVGMALSPDGELLAVAYANHSVAVWALKSRRLIARIEDNGRPPLLLRFSADSRTLRTNGDRDGRQTVWDSTSGRLLSSEDVAVDPRSIYSSWVLGERWFLTADSEGELRLWDRSFPDTLVYLRGHTKRVNSAAISNDEDYLATGSEDETTRLWRLVEGRQQALFPGPGLGSVAQVAFDPSGDWLATVSERGILRWWSLDGDTLKQLASQRIPDLSKHPEGAEA